MSEQAPETVASGTEGAHELGPLARLTERITGHAEAIVHEAEAKAATLADDLKAAVQSHASSVFDVAGDLLKALAVIDPADATAMSAISALVPKVLAMAGSAAQVASTVLRS